ncbi:MAG UNVERIFIED_CONTAM: hypothetical protein LVT10_00790 [Anaerolineae bacterium]
MPPAQAGAQALLPLACPAPVLPRGVGTGAGAHYTMGAGLRRARVHEEQGERGGSEKAQADPQHALIILEVVKQPPRPHTGQAWSTG